MFAQTNSKQRALIFVLTILGCLLALFFGLRAFHAFKKFGGHLPPPRAGEIETDVGQIREWMTIPFIARAHGVPIVGVISVVIGDTLSYSFGYYARERVLERFSETPPWKEAEISYRKWGVLSIFFSRFLVTGIALPVNLMSGTTRFPFKKMAGLRCGRRGGMDLRLRRTGLSPRQSVGIGQ